MLRHVTKQIPVLHRGCPWEAPLGDCGILLKRTGPDETLVRFWLQHGDIAVKTDLSKRSNNYSSFQKWRLFGTRKRRLDWDPKCFLWLTFDIVLLLYVSLVFTEGAHPGFLIRTYLLRKCKIRNCLYTTYCLVPSQTHHSHLRFSLIAAYFPTWATRRKRRSFCAGYPLPRMRSQSLHLPRGFTLLIWPMYWENWSMKRMERISLTSKMWLMITDGRNLCSAGSVWAEKKPATGHQRPSRSWNHRSGHWCGNGQHQLSKLTTQCLKKWLTRKSARQEKREKER